MRNGQVIGQGEQFSVDKSRIGQSISCRADMGNGDSRESSTVGIAALCKLLLIVLKAFLLKTILMKSYYACIMDIAAKPILLGTNFAAVRAQLTNGRMKINTQQNLECRVSGNPRPYVVWRQLGSDGFIHDTECGQGQDFNEKQLIYGDPVMISL